MNGFHDTCANPAEEPGESRVLGSHASTHHIGPESHCHTHRPFREPIPLTLLKACPESSIGTRNSCPRRALKR
jgi:hypothetical protein